jgi:hypothetical protein
VSPLELICHPARIGEAVRGVRAVVRRSASGVIAFTFYVEADLTRIRIPAAASSRITTGLWQHTCFEAFIAIDGRAEYHELNFAPSGEWAAYAFRAYRDGGLLSDETLAPAITLRADAGVLELGAVLDLRRLSPVHPRASLRVGLSAVIEESDGRLSYWALRHLAPQPDFHDAAGFTLWLESLPA